MSASLSSPQYKGITSLSKLEKNLSHIPVTGNLFQRLELPDKTSQQKQSKVCVVRWSCVPLICLCEVINLVIIGGTVEETIYETFLIFIECILAS